jgi:hypothetical protein
MWTIRVDEAALNEAPPKSARAVAPRSSACGKCAGPVPPRSGRRSPRASSSTGAGASERAILGDNSCAVAATSATPVLAADTDRLRTAHSTHTRPPGMRRGRGWHQGCGCICTSSFPSSLLPFVFSSHVFLLFAPFPLNEVKWVNHGGVRSPSHCRAYHCRSQPSGHLPLTTQAHSPLCRRRRLRRAAALRSRIEPKLPCRSYMACGSSCRLLAGPSTRRTPFFTP